MKATAWITPAKGFAAAACILGLLGIYVVLSALSFTRDLHWVTHSYQVIAKLERLNALEHEAITQQRTHLLTGSRASFEAHWQAAAQAKLEAGGLLDMVSDNSAQSDQANQLGKLLDERLNIVSSVLDTYRKDGLAAAQAQVNAGQGIEAQRAFDGRIATIRKAELDLLDDRADNMRRSLRWLLSLSALGFSAGLIILGAAYRLVARKQRERLQAERQVTEANRELGFSVSRLSRLSQDMEELGRYAGMLQSAASAAEALEITRQFLQGQLPGLAGAVYQLRASKDHAERMAEWGDPLLVSDAMPAPSDCWSLRRNQVYALDCARVGVRCAHVAAPAEDVAAAYACIPLAAQGETLGWLHLSGPGPGPLPGLDLAVNASEQLSLALANLRLKEALRNLAIRDPLTGLFNRRYLEESLARELARCRRRGLPFAVLMFDLDHFKAFNDANGHPGGDALLAAFGGLLQSLCRAEDIACRYGGEEFTLILPEASLGIARAKAEEIRLATAELAVLLRGRELPKVTVSIGLAAFPEHGGEAVGLLASADKALYEAKTGGRNRVAEAPEISA